MKSNHFFKINTTVNADNAYKILDQHHNFVVGNKITTFVPTDYDYYKLFYYVNDEVREGYLQMSKDKKQAFAVDSPDDESCVKDYCVSFHFSAADGKLTMTQPEESTPLIACKK